MQSERTINNIKLNSGNLTTDPVEINNHFRDFYQMLYKSEYNRNKKSAEIVS